MGDEEPTEPTSYGSKADSNKDALAARVLVHRLENLQLPTPRLGEPLDLPVRAIALRIAREMLYQFSVIYGLDQWDYKKFKQFLAEGALATWRPGTRVVEDEHFLTIESSVCPLGNRTWLDPRVCHTCRLALRTLVTSTTGIGPDHASFESLKSLGEDTCSLLVQRPASKENVKEKEMKRLKSDKTKHSPFRSSNL